MKFYKLTPEFEGMLTEFMSYIVRFRPEGLEIKIKHLLSFIEPTVEV